MDQFQRARAVWGEQLSNKYNQFLGFHTRLQLQGTNDKEIRISIAARSYYRLYQNGQMLANGPARTARGYCRVDRIKAMVHGIVDIAVEVVAFDKPVKYCNDCTLEPGMLTVEISDVEGHILSATGEDDWQYEELLYRRSVVETMSHSRGIVEYYALQQDSTQWRVGKFLHARTPVPIAERVQYLPRRAPYPTYQIMEMNCLQEVTDLVRDEEGSAGFVYRLARDFNAEWYAMLPEENLFLESLRKERDVRFTGTCVRDDRRPMQWGGYQVTPGEHACSLVWGIRQSELGFLEFEIETSEDCVLDIVNSDHLNMYGAFRSNTYASRYQLSKGQYHIITMEPRLVRYVRVILRTGGTVSISNPRIIDDSYPDAQETYFECSDGDLNRIYEGARRTLRLSTLDIFMDCPQRERGGWLCDSQFSAYAAHQLFGDTAVERDFLENYMLTDGDVLWHGFFPDVYPGTRPDPQDPGIANWSFWLLTELYAYYRRTGDRAFIDQCAQRVALFVDGLLELRSKESGLIEGLQSMFVDWSLSNRSFALSPISIPINCHAVRLLREMGELYHRADWRHVAEEMTAVIEALDDAGGVFGGGGDGAQMIDGRLARTDCQTESGVALEIWSGFHREDQNYMNYFVNTMGIAPLFRANPNIGKSNQFIGLMVRLDVLRQLGKISTLVHELRELYLPELQIGSGTFFENVNAISGCHGFNGAAAAMITNEVLGLGVPMEGDRTFRIAPHPGDLRWARGSARTSEGMIYLRWSADQDAHVLRMTLTKPEGWTSRLEIPFELCGWEIYLNDRLIERGK